LPLAAIQTISSDVCVSAERTFAGWPLEGASLELVFLDNSDWACCLLTAEQMFYMLAAMSSLPALALPPHRPLSTGDGRPYHIRSSLFHETNSPSVLLHGCSSPIHCGQP